MPWFKVDDQLHSHPKVVALCDTAAGRTALGLWVRAGSYCGAHPAQSGHVQPALMRSWGFDQRHAKALVSVGLWHITDEGWRFHDWHEFQPEPGKDAKQKEQSARRSRDYRDRKRDGHDSVTRDSQGSTDHARASTRPVPTRPEELEDPIPVEAVAAVYREVTNNSDVSEDSSAWNDFKSRAVREMRTWAQSHGGLPGLKAELEALVGAWWQKDGASVTDWAKRMGTAEKAADPDDRGDNPTHQLLEGSPYDE